MHLKHLSARLIYREGPNR